MEIMNDILIYAFVVAPILGGMGFFFWKALQMEMERTKAYTVTLRSICSACDLYVKKEAENES